MPLIFVAGRMCTLMDTCQGFSNSLKILYNVIALFLFRLLFIIIVLFEFCFCVLMLFVSACCVTNCKHHLFHICTQNSRLTRFHILLAIYVIHENSVQTCAKFMWAAYTVDWGRTNLYEGLKMPFCLKTILWRMSQINRKTNLK